MGTKSKETKKGVATTPIEEWLDYLKNGRIKDDTTTPGLAEGRAEGHAEGELSKAKSIARKMKEMGASQDFIIQATGLTAKEIDLL